MKRSAVVVALSVASLVSTAALARRDEAVIRWNTLTFAQTSKDQDSLAKLHEYEMALLKRLAEVRETMAKRLGTPVTSK